MRKYAALILSLLLSMSLCGCGKGADTVMPLLLYSGGEAQKAAWNIGEKTLQLSGTRAFEYSIKANDYIPVPLYWNGADDYVVYNSTYCAIEGVGSSSVNHLDDFATYGIVKIVGAGVIVSQLGENPGGYRATIMQTGETVEIGRTSFPEEYARLFDKSKYNMSLCYAAYDHGTLTAVFCDYLDFTAYVCRYSVKKETWSISDIPVEAPAFLTDQMRMPPPHASNCVRCGNVLYLLSASIVGRLDLAGETGSADCGIKKEYESFMEVLSIPPENKYVMTGLYGTGDTLIVYIPVSRGTSMESLYVAFRDDELIGALHFFDGNTVLYDENGAGVSVHLPSDIDAIVFPSCGGTQGEPFVNSVIRHI